MSTLTDLADYQRRYSKRRANDSRDAWGALYGKGSPGQQQAVGAQQSIEQAVEMILASDFYTTEHAKHFALYHLAERHGATGEDDFDPAWRP